jgi:uncharacterized membrane protein YoaK (UPF0700 family)
MELQAQARGMPMAIDWLLTALLSTTAGAVDVIGFLALGGLFTAHITGNLVVLAAHYVIGGFSQIGPLLSVPVFVVVLGIVTVLFAGKATRATRRTLLMVHVALLAAFLGLGVGYGPFPNAESAVAVFVGMVGVAAMATQNALVKLELWGLPATAVMTTNTVQLTIDIATLARRQGDPVDLARVRHRAQLTFPSVGGFVAGCAAGAFLQMRFGLWALLLPVALATAALLLDELRPAPQPV